MYKESFIKVVIETRTDLKLSKQDMAAKLKMSYPTYLKFENEGKIDINKFIEVCNILGLHIQIMPKRYI
jgi:transcriptional regulator with XRE-family HTH domain